MSVLTWLCKCFSASSRAEHAPAGPTTSPPPGGPIQQVFSPSAVARAQPETPESCTSGAAEGAQAASVSQHGLDPAPTVPEEQQQRSLQQTVQHGGSQSLVELVASEALQAGSSAGGEHGQARSAPQEMGQPLDPRIRVPFNEIRLYSVIGKGGFKTVYRGAWNNTHVAVVAMRRGGLVAEARLLQRLSTHPNLVQLYRWSADESGNEYLVMELLPLGSLDAVLRCIGRQLLTQTKMTVVEQLASACLELAHEGLIHGDLAARNLLVKSLEPPHVKLADFGLSRPAAFPGQELGDGPSSLGAPMPAAPNSVVPARWAAPEVLAGEPPSEAADVWSFGMVCWEIFSNGAEPYASLSNREILHALRSGYRLERPRGCPLELWGLVQSCWRDEPRERPSFTTITTTLRNWREAYVSSRVALRGAAAAGSQAPLVAAAGLPSEATLPILGAGGMSTARGRSGGSAALQPGGQAPGTDLLLGARGSRVPPAGAAPRGVARPPLAASSPAAAAGAAGGGSSTWRQTPSSPPQSPEVPTFEPPTLSPAPLLSRALAGEAAGEPQGFALRGVLPALVTGESGTGSGTGSPRGDAAASTGFLTPTGATAADGTSGSVTGGMGLWAAAGPHTGRAGRGPSGVHMSTHMSFELGEPPIQPVLDTASSTQVSSTNALPTPPISLSNAGAAAAAPSLDAAVADLAAVPQLTADASPQQPLQDVRLVSGSAVVGVASSSPSNVMGQVLGPAAASQLPPPAAPTGLGGAGSGAGRDSNTRSTILSGVRDSSRPSDSPRSGDMFSARAGGLYSGRADAGWGGQRHTLAAFGLASGPDGSAAGAAGRSGLYHTGAAAVDRQRLDRSFSSDCQPGVTPEYLMQQQLAGAAAAAAAAEAAAAAAAVGALHVRGAAAAVLDTSPYVRIRDLTLPALPPAAAAAGAGTLVGSGAPLTPIRGDQADINAGGNAEALAFQSRRQARIPREQQRPRTAAAAEAAMASLPRDTATTAGALSPSPEGPLSVGASQQGQQHQMQPDRILQQRSASPQERVTVVAVQPLGAGGIGVGGVGSSTTEDLSLSNMPHYTSSAGTFAFASAQRRSSAQALGGRPSAAGTESTATLFGPPIGSTQRLPFGVFCLPSGAHDADQMGVSTSQLSISRVQQLQPEMTLQGLGGQAFRASVVAEHENEGVDETEEEDTAKLEAVPISVDAPRSHDEPVPLSHPRPLQAPAGSTASAVGLQEYHRPHPASITAVAVADAMASAASAAAAAAAVVRLSSANAAVVDVDAEARPDLPAMFAAARCSAGEPAVRGEAQAIAAAPAGASQHLSLGPGDNDEAETMSEEWAMAEVSATISRTGINGGPSSSRQEGASLGRAPSAMATGAVPSGSSAVGTGVSFALADAGEESPASDGGVTSYGNTSALAASLASDLRMSAASRLHVLQPTPSRLRASARRHDTEDAQRQSASESPAQGCTPSPSPPPVQQPVSLTLVRQRMPLVAPATSAVLASVQTRRRRRGSNGSSRTSGSYRCRSHAGSVASSYASSRSRQRVGGQSSNKMAATAVAAGTGPGTASDTTGGLLRTATSGRAGGPTTAGLGTATAVAPAFLLGTAPAGLEGWRYGPLSPSSLSSRSARTVVSTLHSSWSGLLYVGPELAGAPAPVPQTAPASGMEAAAASSGQAAEGAAGEGAQARHDHARAKPGADAARLSSREVRGTAGTATAPTHMQLPAPQLGPNSGGGDGAVATATTLSGGQPLSTEQSGSGRVRQGAAAAARGSRDSQATGGTGITASTGTGVGMLVGRSGGFMELLQELPLSRSGLMPGASASSVPFALPATGIADTSASNAGTAGTTLTGAAGAVPASPPGGMGVPVRPVGAGGGDALGVGSMSAAGVVMGAGQGPAGPRSRFVARGYAAAPLYGSVDAPASPSSGAATAASARLVPPGTGAGPGSGVPSAPDVVRTGLVTGSGGTSNTEGGGGATLPGVDIDGQMEAGGRAGGTGPGPSAGLYGTAVTGSSGFVMMPGSSGLGSPGVLFNYVGPLMAQQAAGASVTSPFTPAAVAAAARAAGGMTAGTGVPAGTAGGAHYAVHNPALAGGAAAGGGSGIDGGVNGLQALLRRRTSTMLVTPPLTAAPSAASHDYLVMRTLGSTAVDEGGGGARSDVPPSLGAGLPSPSEGVPGNVAERLAAYRADALPVAAQLPMTADATGQQNTNFGAAELAAWLAGAGASSPGGGGSAGDGSSYGPLGPSCEAAAIAQLQQLHQQHQMRQFQQQQRQQQRLAQQQQDLPRRPQSLDLPERGAVSATSDTREPPYALAGPDAVATERVAIFAWMQQRHLDQLHEDRSW